MSARRQRLILIASVAALLLALVYWRAISTYRAPYRLLTDLPIPVWIDQLYRLRWVVRGGMAAAGLVLAALELFYGSLSRELRLLLSSRGGRRWGLFVLLTLLALAGRSYLLAPGRIALTDGLANVANVMAIRVALQQGHLPPYFWSNNAFMGFPWLQFHNSAFYYEGALLDFVLREGFLSTKLTLLLNHVLGVWAMFFYVRSLARSTWAGLVSATVWATAFFHYHYFVHVGSIHLSLFLPLLPAALYCVEAVLRGQSPRRAFAGLAFVQCLLLWAHPFYGMVTAGLIAVYAAVRLLARRSKKSGQGGALNNSLVRLALCGAALALGGVAALSQWLPPAIEQDLVAGGNVSARFLVPFPDWAHVLSFRGSFLTPDWWGGYLGLSVVGLAALGAALALWRRDRRAFGLLAWIVAAWWLSMGMASLPYDWIQDHLPFGDWVIVVAAQRKYLMFLEFGLAAGAGLAVREIALALRGWRWGRRARLAVPRLALLASVAVAGEMLFLNFQVNSLYPEAWVGLEAGRQEYLDWAHANGDRKSRLLDTYLGNLEVPALSGQPSFIAHYEEQPPSGGGIFVLMDAIRQDASAGHLTPLTRDKLYLLDIGYVVLDQPPPADSGWSPGYTGQPFSLWEVPQHSPIIAAARAVPASELGSGSSDETIRAMNLDPATATAELIPTLSDSWGQPGAVAPRLTVEDYQVDLTRMRLTYTVDTPAVLQLSYSAYPYLNLYMDGRQVDYFSTAFYLIGLETPAGEHTLELRPVLSPLRKLAYGIDGLGLLLIAAIAIWGKVWPFKPPLVSSRDEPLRRTR